MKFYRERAYLLISPTLKEWLPRGAVLYNGQDFILLGLLLHCVYWVNCSDLTHVFVLGKHSTGFTNPFECSDTYCSSLRVGRSLSEGKQTWDARDSVLLYYFQGLVTSSIESYRPFSRLDENKSYIEMAEPTKPRAPIAPMFGSPGPCYKLPSLIGQNGHDFRSTQEKAPAYQFGVRHKAYSTDSSPGPIYSLPALSKTHKNALPQWSLSSRCFPPQHGESRLNVPGPGAYNLKTSDKQLCESAPAYSFGTRHAGRKHDRAPAPNHYSLPVMVSQKHCSKTSAPQYSVTGRSKVGGFSEDLQKTPGPGAYSVDTTTNMVKDKAPSYSITSRTFMPGDATQKPGPGAHSVIPGLNAVTKREPQFSFGIRHSQFTAPVADLPEVSE